MKKTEKYYPVNRQEDEDGYAGYPANATTTKTEKAKQNTSSRITAVNKRAGSTQLQFHRLSLRFR